MKRTLSTLLGAAALAAAFLPSAAEAQTGYQYYAVTPCRLYDTRSPSGSARGDGGGIISTVLDTTTRKFIVRGACGIPSNATAASFNFTVISPTAPVGNINAFPNPGTPVLTVSTLNFAQNETIANGAIVPLGTVTTPGTDEDLQILSRGRNNGVPGVYTLHLVIDVTGYFAP